MNSYEKNINSISAGILAGVSKGKVWKDDEENPRLMAVYSYCADRFSVEGDIDKVSDEKLQSFVDGVIDKLKLSGFERVVFSSESPRAYVRILNLYMNRKIMSELEITFIKKDKIQDIRQLPEEYTICKVDNIILEKLRNKKIKNSEMFLKKYKNSWKSDEDFYKYSDAFIALQEDTVVGMVLGASNYEETIPAYIEVDECLRHIGLGTRLVQEMVNCCVDKNRIVEMVCDEMNIKARGLAGKLGFESVKRRPIYWFEV